MEQVVYGKSLKKKIDSRQNSIERMKEERRKEHKTHEKKNGGGTS